MALVRAKVTHTEPVTHAYREEGEQFDYAGELYKHVEAVKQGRPEPVDTADENDKTTAHVTKKRA